MTGVSPAFYVSRCSKQFSFSDLIDSLYWLKEREFQAMQLEVFFPEQLDQWTDENCSKLVSAVEETGIKCSQFVAHFLLENFVSSERLLSDRGLDEMRRIAGFIRRFQLTDLVTMPLGAFQDTLNDDLYDRFIEKLQELMAVLSEKGIKMAVEPMPGSLGADLAFLKKLPEIGLNLDPGHMLCSGIDPFSLEKDVLERVYATHLCDNNAVENTSSVPGSFHGREDWERLLKKLRESGYDGSMDIEIVCPTDEVEEKYLEGRDFINSFEYNIVHSK